MVTVKKRKFKPVSKGDTGLPIMSGGDQALRLAPESCSQKDDPAKRHDAGKPRVELMPPDALLELGEVYRIGAEKYAEDNWAKGMHWRRVVGSMMRHTLKWCAGEDTDSESGLHHMAHVAWGALTLIAYSKRKVGVDDRMRQFEPE